MAKRQMIITDYKWAGKFWFFRIKTRCEECDLSTAILEDMKRKEFKGLPVKVVVKNWLDNPFEPFFKSGLRAWHAPIIMVDGEVISQGKFVPREKLAQRVYALLGIKDPLLKMVAKKKHTVVT